MDGLDQDNRDQDWLAPPSRDDEERQPKRPRTDDGKGRGRNQRMFGMLAHTLKTAREQSTNKTDAAKKRQAIEERLAEKKKEEALEVEKEVADKKLDKQLRLDVLRKEDEKNILTGIYHARHAAAAHLAGFLCTSFDPPSVPADSTLRPPIEPSRPLSLGPSFKSGARPVYYLPAKLLPSQRATIDVQISATQKAIEDDEAAFDEERRDRTRELIQLREKRDELKEHMRGPASAPPTDENGDATMQDQGETVAESRERSKSRSGSMEVDRSPTLA